MSVKLANTTILVVDDERFVLGMAARVLNNMGIKNVLLANTGQEALEIIDTTDTNIDLALIDLNMPDMDGVDLIRSFEQKKFKGQLLIFSGEDEQTINMAESLARARSLCVLGSLSKPLQPDTLHDLIKNRPSHLPPQKAFNKNAANISAEMLEAAIAARELEPWFQPKIDIATQKPTGVEALARWPNSAQGPVYPDQFIPVAEKHNLISSLTFLITEKTSEYIKSWHQQGINLGVAVNVSMGSLDDLSFPKKLEEHIIKGGALSGNFQLEITESQLMQNIVVPLDVLLRLRLKKIKLSIDDFGTGHSNLSQLRDLPFDEFKLDRSYVQGALHDKRVRAILESSVDMAKKLGMSVVAEGIETKQDWETAKELGCDVAQGWLLAKAMPGSEVVDWLRSWDKAKTSLL